MRRILITCTALAVLVAGAAYAASPYNNYNGTGFTFSPKKAGSPKAPSPLGFKETLNANGPGGTRAAPLSRIQTWYYGLIAPSSNKFPKCTDAMINAAKTDTGCPKGAMVASGQVMSLLGNNDLSNHAAIPCNPALHVWNGGGGTLVFFFFPTKTKGSKYYCDNLTPSSTPPYNGHVKQQGKYLYTDIPLPPSISTNVIGLHIYGSLIHEVLVFRNLTVKSHGKTYGFQSSVGCQSGKRPWKVTYTALAPSGSQTTTVKGKAGC